MSFLMKMNSVELIVLKLKVLLGFNIRRVINLESMFSGYRPTGGKNLMSSEFGSTIYIV